MQQSGLVITVKWISKHNIMISQPATNIHFYMDTDKASTFKTTMSLLTSQYYNYLLTVATVRDVRYFDLRCIFDLKYIIPVYLT